LQQWYEEYSARDVLVLAIEFMGLQDEYSRLADYASRAGLLFPVVLDPQGEVADACGVLHVPLSVAVDRNGIVQRVLDGFGPMDAPKLRSALEAIAGPGRGGVLTLAPLVTLAGDPGPFVFRYEPILGEEKARLFAQELAEWLPAPCESLGVAGVDIRRARPEVRLYASYSRFAGESGAPPRPTGLATGLASYSSTKDGARSGTAFVTYEGYPARTAEVLRHEFVHLLMWLRAADEPAWLTEGAAQVLSGQKCPNITTAGEWAGSTNQWPDPAETSRRIQSNESMTRSGAYTISHLAVECIAAANAEALKSVLTALEAGRSMDEALKEVLGVTQEQFWEQVRLSVLEEANRADAGTEPGGAAGTGVTPSPPAGAAGGAEITGEGGGGFGAWLGSVLKPIAAFFGRLWAWVTSSERQPFATVFEAPFSKTFGGSLSDSGEAVCRLADGGYVVAGWTDAGEQESFEAWLVKIDSSGAMGWSLVSGGILLDRFLAATVTRDGGVVAAGHREQAGHWDGLIVKAAPDGTEAWSRTVGGFRNDLFLDVTETADGGLILAGRTWSEGAGQADAWLVRTYLNGEVLWSKTFGGTGSDEASSVRETLDGGFILAGATRPAGPASSASSAAWLIRTDACGNELWSRRLGGGGKDSLSSVRLTLDGGFVLAGRTQTSDGDPDAWLVVTDAEGNPAWQQTFGGPGTDYARVAEPTADGGYVVCGAFENPETGSLDAWLLKTDSAGNEVWARTFGGSGTDLALDVTPTAAGGYVVTGRTWSSGAGRADLWLIRTDAEGRTE